VPDEPLTQTVIEDRFEQVLADFLQAEECGERPNLSQVIREFPELEGPLREFLRNRAGFDKLAPHLAPTATQPEVEATQLELPLGSRFGGYIVLQEIGHGGRGVVYRVRDPELNRPLAVKVLRHELRDEPDAVRRFLEEAQVMGQLQHPGIVPVHAVGQLPDGRPYFAMKLVQGHTLAELLGERPDPAHDLPRFLVIFQQVCQAVGYAHSRGVIHRDLKPTNIMVGAFAEVQVMDWGLAKVLTADVADHERPRGEQEAQILDGVDTIRTVRTEETGHSSVDGLVVGTFAYMSPEQAKGQVEQADPRVDVFGLGAILCEILTGLPPYAGRSAWELHLRAAEGDVANAHARLDGCGADVELIALTKDCLAVERERRPRDAGAVAERLVTYLAGVQERLHRAELERAAAEARRAEAEAKARAEWRARRLAVGLIAVTLLVVLTGGGGWLWVQHVQTQRKADHIRQLQEQRYGVEAALDKVAVLQKEARWKEAKAVLEEAGERLGDSGPPDLFERVQRCQSDLALVARLDRIREDRIARVSGRLDNRAAARQYEEAFREAGLWPRTDDVAAIAARIRNSAIKEELVAALDDCATANENVEREGWLLEVVRRADPEPWLDHFRDPSVRRDKKALEALADELLRDEAKLARLKPQSLVALGAALARVDGDPSALLAMALALHMDDFWLNELLGETRMHIHKWDEAEGYYRAALAARPQSVTTRNSLGAVLAHKQKNDEAIHHFRTAIALDKEYDNAHSNLAYALMAKGQIDEAIKEFGTALALNPNNAKAHNGYGMALYQKKEVDRAIGEFQIAAQLDQTASDPHIHLGEALWSKRKLDDAIRELRTAIDLDSKEPRPHFFLGRALAEKKLLDDAIREFRTAIQLYPNSPDGHFCLGNALREKKQLDEAIQEYREAIKLNRNHSAAHGNLAGALSMRGQANEAILETREAIKLDPKNAFMHHNLGILLRKNKQLEEAALEFREAIKLDDKYAKAYAELGLTLMYLGHFTEARELGLHCQKLPAADASLRQGVAWLLRQCEQGITLDRKLATLVAGREQPTDNAERLALARHAQQPFHKQFLIASRLYAEAFTHEPKLTEDLGKPHRYNAACSATLAAATIKSNDKEQMRLRQQALDWLRADLALWENQVVTGNARGCALALRTLWAWQNNPDLASVRDKDGLAKLTDRERKDWEKFWANVDALRTRARQSK
jgi:serine/threonine-protein kinase